MLAIDALSVGRSTRNRQAMRYICFTISIHFTVSVSIVDHFDGFCIRLVVFHSFAVGLEDDH